jgi:hypothetical protein
LDGRFTVTKETAMTKRKGDDGERDDGATRLQKPSDWNERLRQVGDARYVEVEWSTRDQPSWPLPRPRNS